MRPVGMHPVSGEKSPVLNIIYLLSFIAQCFRSCQLYRQQKYDDDTDWLPFPEIVHVYCTRSFMSKIGNKIASTITSTTTPIKRIMAGSNMPRKTTVRPSNSLSSAFAER